MIAELNKLVPVTAKAFPPIVAPPTATEVVNVPAGPTNDVPA